MTLSHSIDSGVAVVTIDHPPLNLVDGGFVGSLIGLLDVLEPDPDVRVVVFRSVDPDFFLMHGDVTMIQAVPATPHTPVETPNIAAVTFGRLSSGRLVTIGLLDGAARGGGCEFLSSLDMRLGTPRSVIGQPEVPMAILPGAGGTARWPRLVGRGRALDVILTGRDLTADEAYGMGWLDRLVPTDELYDTGWALARRIAAMPAASIAAVKRVVDISLGSLEPALVAETNALGELMASTARQDAMATFMAAGGQTREVERDPVRMAAIVDTMLNG